jgi:hypothetical protein
MNNQGVIIKGSETLKKQLNESDPLITLADEVVQQLRLAFGGLNEWLARKVLAFQLTI